jgi:hypothetical protein
MAEAMGVPLKKENEEWQGNTTKTRGSEGGRRGFIGTSMHNFRWLIPHPFSARLTHGLKLDTVVWLLRCSVLRGTPVASAKNIQFQKANVLPMFNDQGSPQGSIDAHGENRVW